MRYGSADIPRVDAIPTGSISLDVALGIGGVPRGRVCEIYGQEASGKTTLALQIIAGAQETGGAVAFIDAEHALDVTYAKALGVNIEEMLISQPDYGEQALEIAETLVRSGAIAVVAIDSVAALVPRAELEGDMGDVQPGAQARLMSQALRKLTGAIHKSECCVVPARRSGSCSARRAPPRAATRSSSTPRSASTSPASAPSRRATRSSATAPGARW
jgi:recombination protein RecA